MPTSTWLLPSDFTHKHQVTYDEMNKILNSLYYVYNNITAPDLNTNIASTTTPATYTNVSDQTILTASLTPARTGTILAIAEASAFWSTYSSGAPYAYFDINNSGGVLKRRSVDSMSYGVRSGGSFADISASVAGQGAEFSFFEAAAYSIGVSQTFTLKVSAVGAGGVFKVTAANLFLLEI